jgi:hypothetical protein
MSTKHSKLKSKLISVLASFPGVTSTLAAKHIFQGAPTYEQTLLIRQLLSHMKERGELLSQKIDGSRNHKYYLIRRSIEVQTTSTPAPEPERKPAPPIQVQPALFNGTSEVPRHLKPVPNLLDKAFFQPPANTESPSKIEVDLAPMVHQLANTLAVALAPVLRTSLDAVIRAEIEGALARANASARAQADVAPVPTTSNNPGAPRKRIAIVGLISGQVTMIKHEFGKEFDLHFINVDDAKGAQLKSHASNSDHIITMGSFINHSVSDTIKSIGVRPLVVHGGMSRLRDVLTGLYLDETPKESLAA